MDLFENMEKKIRILSILYQLLVGNQVSVAKLAEKYQVSTKSINRDISIIYKELIDMVQTVNADCVVPEEKLADHVYYFDWEKRRMAILKKKNLC